MTGIPIVVSKHLPADAVYFAADLGIIFASPEALRWFRIAYLAGDWPGLRDFAGEEC